MLYVLQLTLPFFAIIGIGAFCRRIGFIEASAGSLMARFAFYVALPPFLFMKVAAAPVEQMLNLGFVIRYEIGTFVIFVGAALIGGMLFRLAGSERAIFGLNAAYSNYGYIGVPLVIMAFGEAAAVPSALILLADSIMLVVLTAGFAALTPSVKLLTSLKNTLLALMQNPLLISVVGGFFWALFSLPVPVVIENLFTMLAGAAAPAALFALGITLAGQSLSSGLPEVMCLSLFKLIVHPLLLAVLFLGWPGIDPLWVQVAILAGCLPIAANVYAMSEYYRAYTGRTAAAILLSTVVASASVPAVLFWLFTLYP